MTIDGEHLLVSGLSLNDARSTGDGVKLAGNNNRLTETAVIGGRHKIQVHFFGVSNRVDHCYLAGKTNDSPTLQVEVGRLQEKRLGSRERSVWTRRVHAYKVRGHRLQLIVAL